MPGGNCLLMRIALQSEVVIPHSHTYDTSILLSDNDIVRWENSVTPVVKLKCIECGEDVEVSLTFSDSYGGDECGDETYDVYCYPGTTITAFEHCLGPWYCNEPCPTCCEHDWSDETGICGNNCGYECSHGVGTWLKNECEPTCMESGYTGDRCCNFCNAILEEGDPIAELDHDYNEYGCCTMCGNDDPDSCLSGGSIHYDGNIGEETIIWGSLLDCGYSREECLCGAIISENQWCTGDPDSCTCGDATYPDDHYCPDCGVYTGGGYCEDHDPANFCPGGCGTFTWGEYCIDCDPELNEEPSCPLCGSQLGFDESVRATGPV